MRFLSKSFCITYKSIAICYVLNLFEDCSCNNVIAIQIQEPGLKFKHCPSFIFSRTTTTV